MSAPAAGATPGGEFGSDDGAVTEAARAARFVLLGGATHGTSEFYAERVKVTTRLLDDHQPSAVVIEADGSEVGRVNLYVRGLGDDRSPAEALSSFRRFPRWIGATRSSLTSWRRSVVPTSVAPKPRASASYGMDVYDLYGALD